MDDKKLTSKATYETVYHWENNVSSLRSALPHIFWMHNKNKKLSFSTTAKWTPRFLDGSANWQQSLSTRLSIQFQHRIAFNRWDLPCSQRRAEILTPCIDSCNSLATEGSPSPGRLIQTDHTLKQHCSTGLFNSGCKSRCQCSLHPASHLGQSTRDPNIPVKSAGVQRGAEHTPTCLQLWACHWLQKKVIFSYGVMVFNPLSRLYYSSYYYCCYNKVARVIWPSRNGFYKNIKGWNLLKK